MCQFSIVGDTLKSEIKTSYIIRKKINKQENNGTSNMQAYIKTKIDNYIKNYLKNSIEFNYDHKGFISIGTPTSSYMNKCLQPTFIKPINLFLLQTIYIC